MTTLKRGSKGNEVQRLKIYLNMLLDPSPNLDTKDPKFDAATEAAVNRLKDQAQLPMDGKVDAATWGAIGQDWGTMMFRERKMIEDLNQVCLAARSKELVPEWMWRLAKASNYVDGPLDIDRAGFFKAYMEKWGSLSMSQIEGLNQLLDFIDYDPAITDLRWAAYLLATVKWECANTWKPIEEYGKGAGHDYGKEITVTGSDGKKYKNRYYGRGYVQLTWEANYKSMSQELSMGEELWLRPERVLEAEIAYKVISLGMTTGKSFANKHKFEDYFTDGKTDYKNARRMVNGLDHASDIAEIAKALEAMLKANTKTAVLPQPTAP
jgi:putative chitinase